MCFTSAVVDQFGPYIPQKWAPPQTTFPTHPPKTYTADELGELLAAFRKAYEAAEKFDALTGQPDCVDPEKAKLIERVEELERRLAAVEGSA